METLKNHFALIGLICLLLSLLITPLSVFASSTVTANFTLKGKFIYTERPSRLLNDLGDVDFALKVKEGRRITEIKGEMEVSGARTDYFTQSGVFEEAPIDIPDFPADSSIFEIEYRFSVPFEVSSNELELEVVFKGRSRNGIILLFTDELEGFDCEECGLVLESLEGAYTLLNDNSILKVKASDGVTRSSYTTDEAIGGMSASVVDASYVAILSNTSSIFPMVFEIAPKYNHRGTTIQHAVSHLTANGKNLVAIEPE